MSTVARYVNTRVVCNNTIEIALNERAQQVKVTHRQVFDDRRVKLELGLLEESWTTQSEKLEKLSKRSVTAEEAVKYFIKVLGDPTVEIEKQRNVAILAKVHALFDGGAIGASLESSKGTAWGLLNAVTEYVDHVRGGKDDGLAKDRRLESAWFYDGAKLKQRAMNDALDLLTV
jgi:phage/plasmid-like protein (TIGR03299 family)